MSTLHAPSIPPKSPVSARPDAAVVAAARPQTGGMWLAAGLALMMISAALLWQRRSPQAARVTRSSEIRTAVVSRGPVIRTLRLTGVTAAANFATLVTPQFRGRRSSTEPAPKEGLGLVLRHAAKSGAEVEKGEVIAQFDRQSLLNQAEDYQAVVTQTEADLKTQKTELEAVRKSHAQAILAAKIAYDKARSELQKVPVLAAIDAERVKLSFDEAERRFQQLVKEDKLLKVSQDAGIRNSELDLQTAKLELRRADADASLMVARAPLTGIAVMQSVFRNGELAPIQEGDQLSSGIAYLQVVDPGSMVVNATVNQVDVDELRLGQRATVRLDAYPGLDLPAHIVTIAAVTKPPGVREGFVKEVPVQLTIDRKDPRVIPDLSVSADVYLSNDDRPAAVVPAGAVYRERSKGQPYVWVQSSAGWVRRNVQIGLTNYLQASIRSGLKPGEIVALDRPGGRP